MRFLADESCDFSVVQALRAAGHDVVAVAKGSLRDSTDVKVIGQAKDNRRILLTEDKDFGQLVFAALKANAGVLFVRYPHTARRDLVPAVLDLVASRADTLYGAFAVIEPGRVRISRIGRIG